MNLHILNGDSTAHIFKNSGIQGHQFIWREVFCEGRIHPVFDDQFWTIRKQEISRLYGNSDHDYDDMMIREVQKINEQYYDEIVLWFEHDFFCQINMIVCIAYLNHLKVSESTHVSLICAGSEIRHGRAATLSDYTATEYENLFDSRTNLSNDDILYIAELFKAFVSPDPNLFFDQCRNTKSFEFLDQTRACFVQLFPQENRGISPLDELILSNAKQDFDSLDKFVREILLQTVKFGFGDVQVYSKLKILQSFFDSIDPPRLKNPVEEVKRSDFIANIDRYTTFFDSDLEKFFPQ